MISVTPAASRIFVTAIAGRAEPDHQHLEVLQVPAGQLHGVQQRRHHHDGRSVLVVVEHRDLELLHQPLLDLEAARRGDVLQVDAAEAGRHQPDRADDLVGVGRVQADREGVHAGELLEQAALALHHGHRRLRADVAQAQHGRAVGDDGDGVALDRVLEGLVLVVGDRQADPGDAGRVDHREVVPGLERLLVGLFDLAADVQQEGAVGRVDHLGAADRADRGRGSAPSDRARRRRRRCRAGCGRLRPRPRRPRRRARRPRRSRWSSARGRRGCRRASRGSSGGTARSVLRSLAGAPSVVGGTGC